MQQIIERNFVTNGQPLYDLNAGYSINVFNLEESFRKDNKLIIEPPHGKTNNLHMRKQRRRSALR